ncbi:hypothetical protein Trydic_g10396 [Trypoxylus dichotomus]
MLVLPVTLMSMAYEPEQRRLQQLLDELLFDEDAAGNSFDDDSKNYFVTGDRSDGSSDDIRQRIIAYPIVFALKVKYLT